MSTFPHDEPRGRREIEEYYWQDFLEWLKPIGFDPRNGESIDTLFWYWYLNNKEG